MQDRGISRVPVVEDGEIRGVVSEADLLTGLVSSSVGPDAPIEKVMSARFSVVGPTAPLGSLLQTVRDYDIAIVKDETGIRGVITRIDLLSFLTDSLLKS